MAITEKTFLLVVQLVFTGRLFTQNKNGTFDEVKNGAWLQDQESEDMGIALIDVDGDNDLDLFIVSGGNEFKPDSKALQDRLYLNNGKGKFTKDNTCNTYLFNKWFLCKTI